MKTGLIIEDLPDSLIWLTDVLTLAFPNIQVSVASNLQEGFKTIAKQAPDIALVDLGLPDGSGQEIIEKLSATSPDTISIVTSIFDDDQHLFSALRAGAKGYVLKDQSSEQMVDLLRGIASGHPPLSPTIARRLLNYFQPTPEDLDKTQLSNREREVLTLIAKGYTLVKVGELLDITRNTTAGYVKIIYRKLNINSRAEATIQATRLGLISSETR
ncbi:MAG: response regulator transcription factor [Thiotrichaceae bacterium]